MVLRVAIIGSGPSGFYTAQALVKRAEDVEIDIIERLPTPYGLIRGGVAPDHQSTKRVTRSYERTALQPDVAYFGNVQVGRDVSMDELRETYDAVVLALGAPRDRPLRIPGEDKTGVIGSAAFVGWYNGHPDLADLKPDLTCKAVAVVGNGNVAIDIARVLVKSQAEMAVTDLPTYARDAIEASQVDDVYLFGRRGPVDAKFTNVELREMGHLEEALPVVDAAQLPDAVEGEFSDRDRRLREKNLDTFRSFLAVDPAGKTKRVHFMFFAKPLEVLGDDKVAGLRLERTRVEGGRAVGTGETFDIDCGLVLPAIGYRGTPLEGVPFDADKGIVVHEDGRVAPGLYAVGWIKRGPTGVIGTNKPDGDIAAEQIITDITAPEKPGRAGLKSLLEARGVQWLDFQAWQKIEAAEEAKAAEGAPREKFVRIEDMLEAASVPRTPG